jgi:hypothetical protein
LQESSYTQKKSTFEKKPQWKKIREIGKITYTLSGCFAYKTAELTIYQSEAAYVVSLYTNDTRAFPKQVTERIITQEQILELEHFISKLKSYSTHSICTTIQSYSVSYKDRRFNKEVTGCDFDYFDQLLGKLSLAQTTADTSSRQYQTTNKTSAINHHFGYRTMAMLT